MPEHLDDTAPRDRETLIAVFYEQLAHWQMRGVDDKGPWWYLAGRLVRIEWPAVVAYSGVTSDIQGGIRLAAYNGSQLTPEKIVHLLRVVHGFAVDAPVGRAA